MDEQIFYSKQLAKTLLFAATAMLAGAVAGYFFLQSQHLLILMAVSAVFAGIPCGWEMTSRLFGNGKNLNLLGLSLMLGVKLVAACLIGWAVLPGRVVYCAAKCCAPWGEEAAYAG